MIHIINLKKDTERRKFMENQINQRKDKDRFIFFEGYDAKKEGTIKTDIELKKYFTKKWNKGLYKNENKLLGRKGCTLSHIRIIKEAVDKGINQVIILEDDCVIEGDFLPPDNLKDDDFLFYFGGGLREKIRKGKINLTPKNYITYELQSSDSFIKIEDYLILGTYAYGINNCGEFYKRLTRYAPIAIDMLYTRYFQSKPIYIKNLCKAPNKFPSNIEDYSTKFIFKELLIKDIRKIDNFKIAVVSGNRNDSKNFTTIKLLLKIGIIADNIFLFLDKGTKEDYLKNYEEIAKVNIIVSNTKGLVEARNFIETEYFEDNEKILCLDDDIRKFKYKDESKEIKEINNPQLFYKYFNCGFKLLQKNNCGLFGVYPIGENEKWFKESYDRIGNNHILAVCSGIIINRKRPKQNTEFLAKEEYERAFLYGKNIRLGFISVSTKYYRKDGIGLRPYKEQYDICNKLIELYPDRYTKTPLKINKKKGNCDLRLRLNYFLK